MSRCPRCAAPVASHLRSCPACGSALLASSDTAAPTEPLAEARSPAGDAAASRGGSAAGLERAGELPSARFLPGTLVAGRYRLTALLGKGGMGTPADRRFA